MNYLVSLCLLLAIQQVQGSEDACPALPNSEMSWSRSRGLIDAINEGRCLDISDKCGECAEQCLDPAYSHWIDKYCAKTCGLCQDEAELVKRKLFILFRKLSFRGLLSICFTRRSRQNVRLSIDVVTVTLLLGVP